MASERFRPNDPLLRLKQQVDRAISKHQSTVSVNPWMVRRLLKMLEEQIALKDDWSEHEHGHRTNVERDGGKLQTMRHAHSRGDIPHGHHGWLYDARPKVEL